MRRICILWSSLILGLLPSTSLGCGSADRSRRQAPPAIRRRHVAMQSPAIFFTDIDSGPNSGGETVSDFSGAYVTLYGNFFGAVQGSSTVTWSGLNCLRVVPQKGSYGGWGSAQFWYQKIVVQLGSSCSAGTGNFVVTVNGQPSNGVAFTIRNGHIYFVSTKGNDSGSGTVASPWATIAKCAHSISPGDICYVENGVSQTAQDNYGAALWINSAGASGKPKAIVAYPGATVTIGGPDPSGQQYGVRIANIGLDGSYWTFAGMTIIGSGTGGAAMNPVFGQSWRLVANLFECPSGNGVGCWYSNEFSKIKFLGNDVTKVSTSLGFVAQKLQHAVYFSSDSNHIEAAWNYIHENMSCRAMQFHSSPLNGGGASDPTGFNQYDLSAHDNFIYGDPCDGIEFETIDPSKGKVEAYNNVIGHTGFGPSPQGGDSGDYSCIRVAGGTNNGPPGSGTVELYNNTVFDCGAYSANWGNNAAWFFDGWGSNIRVRLRNNVTYLINGTPSTERYLSNIAAGLSELSGSNNLWYGAGSAPAQCTANLSNDPFFVSPSQHKFNLQFRSPAIDAGISINNSNVYSGVAWNGKSPTDILGVNRPQGSPFDMGAFEYYSPTGSTAYSPCDLNKDGVVNGEDVQLAVNQAVGISACGSANLQQNGACNVVDVQRIINASLGQTCRLGP